MYSFRNWWHDFLPAMLAVATLGLPLVRVSADEPKTGDTNSLTFRTATIIRGDLVTTVNAVGTVEPEEMVEVGPQVAGRVTSFGPDIRSGDKSIDSGSPVEEGTLLAQIDDTMYTSQVEQARASCMRAEAESTAAKAKLELAKAEWQRAQDRIHSKSISASDLDVAKCTYVVAQASIAVAEATLVQSHVALKQAETNLGYTRIRSPVKGIIIARRVNLGQTVVVGANVPSLFLIAKDLKKLQIWASVNEADIGQIRVGQPVRFTVDAYPGKSFRGTVGRIRLNAALTQNVVTYTVVIATNNRNERLLPYLTANVQFEVGHRKDVLLVPNTALRWRPQPQWIAPDFREKTPSHSQGSRIREGHGDETARHDRGQVWVQDGKFVRPIAVKIGLSDGVTTEIGGDNVTEGMEIIVGESVATKDAGQGRTPRPPSSTGQLSQRLLTPSESRKAIERVIASMGVNLVMVLPGTAASGGVSFGSGSATTLTSEDADEIARRCPDVSHVAPVVRGRAQIVYGNRNWVPYTVNGTTPSFLAARDWEELAEGAAFTDADVRNANKVCLIGDTLKRELFQNDSPIGKEVRIQNVAFKVIGVLTRKGANIMGLDQDDIVLAPWTTIKYRVIGSKWTIDRRASSGPSPDVNSPSSLYPGPSAQMADTPLPVRFVAVDQIVAKAASAEAIPQAIDEITQLLRQRHHIRPGENDDFNIRDMTELTRALLSSPSRS